MAKVKFGPVLADARGKLGGLVYSRNRAGAYVREKVTPVNPSSARQQVLRARLSTLAAYWGSDLTGAQRASWKGFAAAHPVTDVFGESRTLSGIAMFQRLNGVILNAGGSQIDVPPADLDINAVASLAASFDVSVGTEAASLTYTPNPVAGEICYVWATPQMNLGVSFYKPRLRFIGVSGDAAASPLDVLSLWTAKFGGYPASGTRIGFAMSFCKKTTGALSTPLYDDCFVTSS